jgi:hypothetical protein
VTPITDFYSIQISDWTGDVVVVRQDNLAVGNITFNDLLDSSDSLRGQRVVTGRTFHYDNIGNPSVGVERTGANVSIAVDPRSSSKVYLAWGDTEGTQSNESLTQETLHLRSSSDSGKTWSSFDIRTILHAINPAVAVNSTGEVGFLYQQEIGGAFPRWETRLEILSVSDNRVLDNILLASGDANVGVSFPPHLGDYIHLVANGNAFFGIFSSPNVPGVAHFPNGVYFQRDINAAGDTLLASNGQPLVLPSIDPFFFRVYRLPLNKVPFFGPCISTPILCHGFPHNPPFHYLRVSGGGWGFTALQLNPSGAATRHLGISGLKGRWRAEIVDGFGRSIPSTATQKGDQLIVHFNARPDADGNYFLGLSPISSPSAEGYKINIMPLR